MNKQSFLHSTRTDLRVVTFRNASLWLSSKCTLFLHAGHSGHEQPEALHPSGRNEPLRSVPLLSVPAELWKRGRAAAERAGRAQQPSWGLWHHKRAGGVPQGERSGHAVLTPQCYCTYTHLSESTLEAAAQNSYLTPIIIAVWFAF